MKGQETQDRINGITKAIIDAGLEVHKVMGPGLLESIYEECMALELGLRGLRFERQRPLPVLYKGMEIKQPHRMDLLVEDEVVVELKAVEKIAPIHEA